MNIQFITTVYWAKALVKIAGDTARVWTAHHVFLASSCHEWNSCLPFTQTSFKSPRWAWLDVTVIVCRADPIHFEYDLLPGPTEWIKKHSQKDVYRKLRKQSLLHSHDIRSPTPIGKPLDLPQSNTFLLQSIYSQNNLQNNPQIAF